MDILHEFVFNKIYILESLQEVDLKTGKELADFIKDDLNYKNILFISVNSKNEFLKCFENILAETSEYSYPIIHLEIHGSREGLLLSNKEFIFWEELKTHLQRINIRSKNNLFLTLAVCSGRYLETILVDCINEPAPFFGLIGSTDILFSSNISIGFKEYYKFMLDEKRDHRNIVKEAEVILNVYNRSAPYKTSFSKTVFFKGFVRYLISTEEQNKIERRMRIRLPFASKKKRKKAVEIFNRMIFNDFKEKFFMLDIFPELSANIEMNYENIIKFIDEKM